MPNNSAFAAQEERSALLERVRELEKQVADLRVWEAEKQRYQLEQVWSGATAYVLKKEAQGSEPIHWLCTNCYHDGKKSILQKSDRADMSGRQIFWTCNSCNMKIIVRHDILPGKPAEF
jgi:hypothetical protein